VTTETKPSSYRPPKAGVAYKVDVHHEQARFDLVLEENSEYDLIVSCLGTFDRECRIVCSAQQIDVPILDSYSAIIPLDIKQRSPLGESLILPGFTRHKEPTSQAVYFTKHPEGTSEKKFYLHVTEGDLSDPKQYACVKAVRVGEGKEVRVYLDAQEDSNSIANNLVEEIVRIIDDEIVPDSKSLYGQCRDSDADGKFTILLSPWLDRLSGGKISIGGFVRSSDFMDWSYPPFGNRCDMMYLNSKLTPGKHLKALLAHEYAHAVAFGIRSQNETRSEPLPAEEDWLSEAIAHLSENYHDAGWSNIDYRIETFLKNTSAYPLVVSDYYGSGMWRNHGCRGATYLFLRWCVDRFGWSFLPRLMNSTSCGIDNVTLCSGMKFEELYRRWSLSLLKTAGEFHGSIDLDSRIGRYELNGPKIDNWNITQQSSRQILLKQTTTTYLKITTPNHAGCFRISLVAKPGANLQVTILKRRSNANRVSSTKPAQKANKKNLR